MWDEQKRTRFSELRSRTSEHLNAPERAELAALTPGSTRILGNLR